MTMIQNQNFTRQGIEILTLIIILFAAFFNLGGYPLLDNNEGLYARIPVEMLESGNWVIPSLNGVPYIEKSPLLYWIIAVFYKLFGISEFTARLTPAISGILLCYSVRVFCQKMGPKFLTLVSKKTHKLRSCNPLWKSWEIFYVSCCHQLTSCWP